MDILPIDTVNASLFVLDTTKLGFGMLRPFHMEMMGKEGDRLLAEVRVEGTFEVPCPRAHYHFSSVKYTD